MSIKEKEAKNEYSRKWKTQKRRKQGIPLKKDCGNNHKPRTEEQKELSKQKRKLYELQWNKDHPYHTRKKEKRLLWAARKRAKEEQVPCTIQEEDIIIPSHCPYLGIPLVSTRSRGQKRNDIASLDKIIPELGYIKGNIEVMSQQANTMKSNATKEQLITFALEVLKRYG